jgi:hypothetical protein
VIREDATLFQAQHTPTALLYSVCVSTNIYHHFLLLQLYMYTIHTSISLHHPLNVHTIAPEPPPKCPLCTLRQPCNNCSYDMARASLVATCTAAAATVSDVSTQLATAQALLQLSPSKGNSRSSIIANKNFAAVMTTAARRELEALTTALHEVSNSIYLLFV